MKQVEDKGRLFVLDDGFIWDADRPEREMTEAYGKWRRLREVHGKRAREVMRNIERQMLFGEGA